MTGVFDSGRGGERTLAILKKLNASEPYLLFCDRKNAPFGNKALEELVKITEHGVRHLLNRGCNRVLIACCTASTTHSLLPGELQSVAIPIIEPAAKSALLATRTGRIAVIATEATVSSGAFNNALGRACTSAIAAGPLVEAVERGESDGKISASTAEYLDFLVRVIAETKPDTLLLGCTHFGSLLYEISERINKLTKTKIKVVDSAVAGALALYANERPGTRPG